MSEQVASLAAIELQDKALGLLNTAAYADAEPLLRKVLEGVAEERNEHGEESSRVHLWTRRLAESLNGQDKFAEAEPLARRAQRAFELRFGVDDADALDAKYLVAESLFGQDNPHKLEQAAELARDAVQGLLESRGPDHFTTIKCKALLSLILNAQGKITDSLALAVSVRDSVLSVDAQATARAHMGGRRLSVAEARDLGEAKCLAERALKELGLEWGRKGGKESRKLSKQITSARLPDENDENAPVQEAGPRASSRGVAAH